MEKEMNRFFKKYQTRMNPLVDSDEAAQKFLSFVNANKDNLLVQIYRTENKKFDRKWIDECMDYFIGLDHITANPKSHLKDVQFITPIELAKKTNKDSIIHLASHTQYIKDITPNGDVIPSKILTTQAEEEYAIYENRFVKTLIEKLLIFVEKRHEYIMKYSNTKDSDFLKMSSHLKIGEADVEFDLQIKSALPSDDAGQAQINQTLLDNIKYLQRKARSYHSSDFMKKLKSAKPIVPPVMMTNIIRKNPDYNRAYKLWLLIESYENLGFEVEVQEKNVDFSSEYIQQLYQLFLLSYAAMNVHKETDIDVANEAARKKVLKPKVYKEYKEEYVEGYDQIETEEILVPINEEIKARFAEEKARKEEEYQAFLAKKKEIENAKKARQEEIRREKERIRKEKERIEREKQREIKRIKMAEAKAKALEAERKKKEAARLAHQAKVERERQLLMETKRKLAEQIKAEKAAKIEAERLRKEQAAKEREARAELARKLAEERAAKIKAREEAKAEEKRLLEEKRAAIAKELAEAKAAREKAIEEERIARLKAIEEERIAKAKAAAEEIAAKARAKAEERAAVELALKEAREAKARAIAEEKARKIKQLAEEREAARIARALEREKAAAAKRERERIERERLLEIERINKEREEERAAKAKALELARLAHEKQIEDERIAREKAIAELKEAKLKALEEERIARLKIIELEAAEKARIQENERLAREKLLELERIEKAIEDEHLARIEAMKKAQEEEQQKAFEEDRLREEEYARQDAEKGILPKVTTVKEEVSIEKNVVEDSKALETINKVEKPEDLVNNVVEEQDKKEVILENESTVTENEDSVQEIVEYEPQIDEVEESTLEPTVEVEKETIVDEVEEEIQETPEKTTPIADAVIENENPLIDQKVVPETAKAKKAPAKKIGKIATNKRSVKLSAEAQKELKEKLAAAALEVKRKRRENLAKRKALSERDN